MYLNCRFYSRWNSEYAMSVESAVLINIADDVHSKVRSK